MLTTDSCPQCGRRADSGPLRLVQDSCGHTKCRECLVNEEAGCVLCTSGPVYTELQPASSTRGEPALPSTLVDEEPVSGGLIASTSSCQDSSPPDQVILSTDCDRQNVEVQVPSEGVDAVPPPGQNAVVHKKAPIFGLKEHITFTPGNPPKYFCKKCNKSYNNRKAARYHNYCGVPDLEKPHTCGECGQGFVTKGHLAYHMKSHTGSLPFSCKTCGKGFKQLSKLNRHSKSHEGTLEKPFRCGICEKAFSTKQILKDHQLSHNSDHSVTCSVCNKKLSSQSCLRKHKKLHSEPIHNCKDCGKKFPVRWSLEVHMKTHQRERKFKCKQCMKPFKMHSDLKRHAALHEGGTEWECKHCNLIFRRRDNLVRHLKNLHPESPRIIAIRHAVETDTEEKQDDPEERPENCSQSSPTVCQAVSVIRTVPVIQKAQAVSETSNRVMQNLSDLNATFDQDTGLDTKVIGSNCRNSQSYSLTSSSTNSNSLSSTYQNYHRESVVCHSDARGVVYHGSSSLEYGYDSNNFRTRPHDSLLPELVESDQSQVNHESLDPLGCEDSSLSSRPRVIVANN